jgi:hypothetical protein
MTQEYIDVLREGKLQLYIGKNSLTTFLVVNDHRVGCIQEIKFIATAGEPEYKLEITFPILDEKNILFKEINSYIEELKHFPFIKIIMKSVGSFKSSKDNIKIEQNEFISLSSNEDFEKSWQMVKNNG